MDFDLKLAAAFAFALVTPAFIMAGVFAMIGTPTAQRRSRPIVWGIALVWLALLAAVLHWVGPALVGVAMAVLFFGNLIRRLGERRRRPAEAREGDPFETEVLGAREWPPELDP